MGLYEQSNGNGYDGHNNGIRRDSTDILDSTSVAYIRGVEHLKVGTKTLKIDLGRDSVIDPADIAAVQRQKRIENSSLYRVRRRTKRLLHTHIALLAVCILSSLDAACVIGQIICDILIMSDDLHKHDLLHEKATPLLINLLPEYLNHSQHAHMTFEELIDYLEHVYAAEDHENHDEMEDDVHDTDRDHGIENELNSLADLDEDQEQATTQSPGHRSKRAIVTSDVEHEHHDHDILHELTHAFHLGSLSILSALLLETTLKVFAMWKNILEHKLEVFDAFVVTVSWCLDVAFYEGLWSRPGQEGATLLIIVLPWRVIRIVNSFVLVIKEKDLVFLKLVKQRLRAALRREKVFNAKLEKYRLEVRQLQGLCRRYGAEETSIQGCCPPGKRRRSSLFQSLTSLASVALVGVMGSVAEIDHVSSSESEGEAESSPTKTLPRSDSNDSGLANPVDFSLTPNSEGSQHSATENSAFKFNDEMLTRMENDNTYMNIEDINTKF